jgi:oligopeptide/dipeptide ABC transporter ATP-binding protein
MLDDNTNTSRVNIPNTIARVSDLKVYFNSKRGIVHSVDGVSFDIRDGETLGLVGETGCGKSVTGRSFLQLLPMPPGILAGGSITFYPHRICQGCGGRGCAACKQTGRTSVGCEVCSSKGCDTCGGTGAQAIDLLRLGAEKMRRIRGDRIAMIFQDPGKALNPSLTIRDQVGEVFLQHRSAELMNAVGISADVSGWQAYILRRKASQTERGLEAFLLALPPLRAQRNKLARALDDMVADALTETQIANPRKLMGRYPHELSGGMRQRVMIAQALACNPDLLIADEPTTALDVTVQARILELISELKERHKTSVLYISHDLSLVRRICDRVAVMYAGRIAEIGTTEQIFNDPRHPYTRGLLAAVPTAASQRGALAAIKGSVPELVAPKSACRFAGRCLYETDACSLSDPALNDVAVDHAVSCFIHHPPPTGTRPSFDKKTS